MSCRDIQWLDPKNVCNLGRVPVTKKTNPFVQTAIQVLKNTNINYKETVVFDYYSNRRFNPLTLADFYSVKSKALSEVPANYIFLPWIHSVPVCEYIDNDFFGFKCDESIYLLVEKIKQILRSFRRYGYKPENFPDKKGGYITGYYLLNNRNKKFYVVSGNHRMAILAALSNTKVPVKFEMCEHLKPRDKVNNMMFKTKCKQYLFFDKPGVYIKDISILAVDNWPAVKSGFIEREIAISIFNNYTDK